MRVYLDRFLNVPPAKLPASTGRDGGNGKPEQRLPEFLDLLNRQQQVDEAGRLVYGYLLEGGDAGELFRTLAESLLREDAEFHSFQVLEAAIRQYGEVEEEEEKRVVVVASGGNLSMAHLREALAG